MKHLTAAALTQKAGEAVVVDGWLQTIRDQGSIVFLIIRNTEGIFQAVVLKSSNAYETSKHLTAESVVKIKGTAKLEQNAPHGVEIMVDEVEVLSGADPELPIPISEKAENEAEQQKRLDWRWLDLRKPEKRLIFEAWTTMEHAARQYWTENGYMEIHSPKMMSIPSEGAAELFEVKYFDRTAYLAQSPQLYKQMAMASGFERIFETGPVFRANPSFTSRHDTEFTGYDMELSFVESHQDVIVEEEKWLVAMISAVKEKHGEAILKSYGREIVVPTIPFPQVTMKQAKELLAPFKIDSDKVDDLNPEEERKLSELIKEQCGHEFVFVTEYPVTARPFYHMRLESDSTLTKSFDLLWNGIEVTTGAQREHRYEQLIAQAKEKGLNLEPLQFYFNFFKYGCPPHGGLGLSPSRLLMKLFDVSNVREVTYLYRGPKRLDP
ncbi:aspartate--tRNA(Asn) ligase [Candidatus Saccharibacteria bacterium 32-49-12]|nr:MAG: aspartate--tRNA(Asn) ligase [Candidatus Saccharibacteria bacterium 32-49-12]